MHMIRMMEFNSQLVNSELSFTKLRPISYLLLLQAGEYNYCIFYE